jgi:NADH-quinone oxidoreductase subunit J
MQYFDIAFYLFALITIVSAGIVVFSKNVVYSAFSLLFTFLGVAGIYVLLQADFVAVAQVMVYVGGILILMIFGVMLTRRAVNVEIVTRAFQGVPAAIIVGVLLGVAILIVTKADWLLAPQMDQIKGTSIDIGALLMTDYLLPFEVAGLLLLVAIMGAAMIARRNPHKEEEDEQ